MSVDAERTAAVSDETIAAILEGFRVASKIFVYPCRDKAACQIVNWWKYQIKAHFMTPSQIDPPPGWIDRWHVSSKSRKHTYSEQWDAKIAGFTLPIEADQVNRYYIAIRKDSFELIDITVPRLQTVQQPE